MEQATAGVLEQLAQEECLRCLETVSVGRVAFTVDGQPNILPVNYAVSDDDGSVVIRVEERSALAQTVMSLVAFEADGIDKETHRGWSVVVKGRCRDVTTSIDADAERLRRLVVSSWAPGDKAKWLAIVPKEITGRRLR